MVDYLSIDITVSHSKHTSILQAPHSTSTPPLRADGELPQLCRAEPGVPEGAEGAGQRPEGRPRRRPPHRAEDPPLGAGETQVHLQTPTLD